jgi:hypothetical protein
MNVKAKLARFNMEIMYVVVRKEGIFGSKSLATVCAPGVTHIRLTTSD